MAPPPSHTHTHPHTHTPTHTKEKETTDCVRRWRLMELRRFSRGGASDECGSEKKKERKKEKRNAQLHAAGETGSWKERATGGRVIQRGEKRADGACNEGRNRGGSQSESRRRRRRRRGTVASKSSGNGTVALPASDRPAASIHFFRTGQ